MVTGVVQLIGPTSKKNQLHLSGILQNGKQHSCAFPLLEEDPKDDNDLLNCCTQNKEKCLQIEADKFLGRQLKDGDWWFKVKSIENDSYWLTRGKWRKVENRFIPTSSLSDEMLKGINEVAK